MQKKKCALFLPTLLNLKLKMNQVTCDSCLIEDNHVEIYGDYNEVRGDFCHVYGNNNIIHGRNCTVTGRKNVFYKKLEEEIPIVPTDSPTEVEDFQCVVCHKNKRNVLLMPCRHLCLCQECKRVVEADRFDTCPLCRSSVASYENVFL